MKTAWDKGWRQARRVPATALRPASGAYHQSVCLCSRSAALLLHPQTPKIIVDKGQTLLHDWPTRRDRCRRAGHRGHHRLAAARVPRWALAPSGERDGEAGWHATVCARMHAYMRCMRTPRLGASLPSWLCRLKRRFPISRPSRTHRSRPVPSRAAALLAACNLACTRAWSPANCASRPVSPSLPPQWHTVSTAEFERKQALLREALKPLYQVPAGWHIRVPAAHPATFRCPTQPLSVFHSRLATLGSA